MRKAPVLIQSSRSVKLVLPLTPMAKPDRLDKQ
jgi:hypothetical protein